MPLPSLGNHGTHLDQFYASSYFRDSSSKGASNVSFVSEHANNDNENNTGALNEFRRVICNENVLAANVPTELQDNENSLNENRTDTQSSSDTDQLANDVSNNRKESDENTQTQDVLQTGGDISSIANNSNPDPLVYDANDAGNEPESHPSASSGEIRECERTIGNDDLLHNVEPTDLLASDVSNTDNEPNAPATVPDSNAQIQEELAWSDESLLDEIANENVSDIDPLANAEQQSQVKIEYVPLYEIHARNGSEMDELLDEPEVICLSDDEEMVIPESGLPRPMATTTDDIVKRENDAISGNVPFNIKVSILN